MIDRLPIRGIAEDEQQKIWLNVDQIAVYEVESLNAQLQSAYEKLDGFVKIYSKYRSVSKDTTAKG